MLLLFCRYFAIDTNFSVSVTVMKHLLDHVHNLLAAVQPQVMVGNGHPLEGDCLGILEERVRSPDLLCH